MMNVYAADPNSNEVWRTYLAKATADISSERLITSDAAVELLMQSDINNPIILSDVVYWMENDNASSN